MIAVHVRSNSKKKPNAKFSIYLQRHRRGISWKRKGGGSGVRVWYLIDGEWRKIVL